MAPVDQPRRRPRDGHGGGGGPRHLGRVLRLGRALERARAGVPLALVAATTGYADQAHLSRECRDLAGTSPTRLLAAEGPGG